MSSRPLEPPTSPWQFPTGADAQDKAAGGGEVVGVGADLAPGTLLSAYRCGLFPMPVDGVLAWWAPDPRAVLPLDGLKVSRSMRRSWRRYEVHFDTAFEQVMAHCSDPSRQGAWISPGVKVAYQQLHDLGWAHSIEAWSPEGELAGGLYGVAVGGLFAGESMFAHQRDASKVALMALVEGLREGGGRLLDVQWATPHLCSLGAIEVSRRRYHQLLRPAIELPQLTLGTD